MILCGGTSLWLSEVQTGEGLLLGSPLGGVASIDANLEEKMEAMVKYFSAHDALTTPLLFPSSITSCGQCHASCLGSWRNTISLCIPS